MRPTVERWISYAREARMFDRADDFLMLEDYILGGLSDEYYRENYLCALDVLENVNKNIGNNRQVCEQIRKIVNERGQ